MQEKYKNSYKATEKELVSLSVTPFWYIQTRRLSTAPITPTPLPWRILPPMWV